jgi:hypothetical protein
LSITEDNALLHQLIIFKLLGLPYAQAVFNAKITFVRFVLKFVRFVQRGNFFFLIIARNYFKNVRYPSIPVATARSLVYGCWL